MLLDEMCAIFERKLEVTVLIDHFVIIGCRENVN